MADGTYQPKVYRKQGGDEQVIASGGTVTVESGGEIDASAGTVKLPSATLGKGFIPLDLFSVRLIVSNDIADETIVSTAGTEKASGGILAVDTDGAQLKRVNGATDKAARIMWLAGDVGEVQFTPVPLPPDLDDAQDVTVHLLAEMAGATDTPTIDVQAFAGKGDTEMGGATAALSDTLAEASVTLAAADIPAHPDFLNLMLVPGAHGTDAIHLYAAWIEYVRKTS